MNSIDFIIIETIYRLLAKALSALVIELLGLFPQCIHFLEGHVF